MIEELKDKLVHSVPLQLNLLILDTCDCFFFLRIVYFAIFVQFVDNHIKHEGYVVFRVRLETEHLAANAPDFIWTTTGTSQEFGVGGELGHLGICD